MRTFLYIYGNPTKATFIAQAENWEEADKRIKSKLEEMGLPTDNYSAQLHELKTPINFV